MQNKYKLVLASASPRRKEILSYLDIPFTVMSSNIEEVTDKTLPSEVVVDLAKIKAEDISKKINDTNTVLIAADTIVVYKNEILGKPKDIQEAKDTLIKLSGDSHEVLTGVCIILGEEIHTFYVETKVKFKTVNEFELNLYLDSKDSLDKAGSYGIQGQAQLFIDTLSGSYSNVVGLPIAEVLYQLKSILKTQNLKSLF